MELLDMQEISPDFKFPPPPGGGGVCCTYENLEYPLIKKRQETKTS